MMNRLLALKKSISEYFRTQPSNPRKLSAREWTVTNEVCSLLDVVSEATIRMQGNKDTHLSQAMFILTEVIAVLKHESQAIRVADATTIPVPEAGIPTEPILVSDLQRESQTLRDVLLEKMEEKQLGQATLKVERICALLDPRRKTLGADQLVNGNSTLRMRAEADLELLVSEFEDAQAPQPVPAPAPAENDTTKPRPAKKKKMSILEQRRAARLEAAAAGGGSSGGTVHQSSGAALTGRRVLLGREILVYLAEAAQLDEDDFDLLGFWARRRTDSLCPTTGKVTAQAEMPFLAFLARLYHAIEATSCQAERNFSALANLIGALRSTMLAYKVERMMFIRLNRHMVEEVKNLDAAFAQARAKVAKSEQKSKAAQEQRSNQCVDMSL